MPPALLLNPARGRRGRTKTRRRRYLTRKQLAALRKGWARARGRRGKRKSPARVAAGRKGWARRKVKKEFGTISSPGDVGRDAKYTLNPRKRGRKGGRSMATRTKKRRARGGRRKGWTKAKRRRAGLKSWRKRLRRYPKNKSSVGRRGYKNNPRRKRWRNPGVAANPRHRRRGRGRNALLIRGGMSGNPRRGRRKGRRRSSSGRRRNPFSLGGTFAAIKSKLTSPQTLMQFGAGAAGATVSEFLGTILAAKIRSFAPAMFQGLLGTVLDAASRIASGVIVGGFLPARFQGAFMLGAGAMALKPFVDQAIAPVLAKTGLAVPIPSPAGTSGVAGWISVQELPRLGTSMQGMGAYMTANQMRRLAAGTSGMGRMGSYGWGYGVPVTSLQDYARQPAAMATFQSPTG